MHESGPVAARLEQHLDREVERHGWVVWVDPQEHYREVFAGWALRAAQRARPPGAIAFDGSWIAWMAAMAGRASGLTPEPLVLYIPGLGADLLAQTPALELILASGGEHAWPLEDLLMEVAQGLAAPEEVRAFLAAQGGGLTLEAAERWLRAARAADSSQIGQELDTWGVERVVDNLLGTADDLSRRIADSSAEEASERVLAVWRWMGRYLGADDAFARFYLGNVPTSYLDLVDVLAAWLMCVEFVQDLRRAPRLQALLPLKTLPPGTVQTCREAIARVREHHPTAYAESAPNVEAHLEAELSDALAEDLGSINTFQMEEQRIIAAALLHLRDGRWGDAARWAREHLEHLSFWAQRDANRRFEWQLIAAIARLGAALSRYARPLDGAGSWEEATARYAEQGALVDAAQRALEQQRAALLRPHLGAFAALLDAANQLRERYRAWADLLAEDFTAIGEQRGFLAPPALQQRRLFEDVVAPRAARGGRIAVLILDNLRFEAALELEQLLTAEGATCDLRPRLAEIPATPAITLNALAPTQQQGRLELAGSEGFAGFRAGSLTVARHDARLRAWSDLLAADASRKRRVAHLTLDELCDRSLESLRLGTGRAEVLLVASPEEAPPERLEHLEARLGRIVAAWRQLRVLGFDTFLFTAPQGTLRRDETTRVLPVPPEARVVHRRYALAPPNQPAPPECVALSFDELGFTGRAGTVITPRRTHVFDVEAHDTGLVYGGLSPQERVVPVLLIEEPGEAPVRHEQLRYRLASHDLHDAAAGATLTFTLEPDTRGQRTLGFLQPAAILLVLRPAEAQRADLTITDVRGGGTLQNQMIAAQPGQEVQVTFTLHGEREERLRLELAAAPGEPAQLNTTLLHGYALTRVLGRSVEPANTPRLPDDWAAAFDTATARALQHIERHGSIDQGMLERLLGSPRAARRFSSRLEEINRRIPFSISMDTLDNMARYRKS